MTNTQKDCELILVLGAGGVGKTTSAAALGMALAQNGKNCVVLTVDPAKRLAQALGLKTLTDESQVVQTFSNGGSLSALWLDSKESFEKLVKKFSQSESVQNFVLNHRLFQLLQSQLGGVEEYLGVERVLSLIKSGQYDVCVLDTPPSKHALDFLDSPLHLLKFFDDGILKHFLPSTQATDNKTSLLSRLISGSKNQALEYFKNFLGTTFLKDLSDLLNAIGPVRNVLKQRAEDIEKIIRTKQTTFIGVSTLESYPIEELRILGLELESRGLQSFRAVVLNKCLPTNDPGLEALQKEIGDRAGLKLYDRFKMQKNIRQIFYNQMNQVQDYVEIPRFSLKTLDKNQLLSMGQGILNTLRKGS